MEKIENLEGVNFGEERVDGLFKDFRTLIDKMNLVENQKYYLTTAMWKEILETSKSERELIYNKIAGIVKRESDTFIELDKIKKEFDKFHSGLCYYFACKYGWGRELKD